MISIITKALMNNVFVFLLEVDIVMVQITLR